MSKIDNMVFAAVYPLYVTKAQRKGRTKDEVDYLMMWLTGYSQDGLNQQIINNVTFQAFFDQAPAMNPLRHNIKGKICGVQIETIEDPLMREIRYLDKLIDELAKGKSMEKILKL